MGEWAVPGSRATGREAARGWTALCLSLLAGAIPFGALAVLGRTTVVGPAGTSLVWPASGAAVLWLALVPKSAWPVHLVVLAVVSAAVNGLTGATPGQTATFAVAVVLQSVVAVLVLQVSRPRLLALPRPRGLRTLTDLGGLCAAAVAGGLVGGTTAGFGLRLLDVDHWMVGAVSWSGRNAAGIVGIAGLGLLVIAEAGPVLTRPVLGARAIRLSEWWPRLPEALLLVATTGGLYSLVFLVFGDLPVAFALLLVTAWAGSRFKPIFVQCHSLAAAGLATWFTMLGRGPFALGLSADLRASISQTFMAVLVVFGLTVSLARRDRVLLIRDLRVAREQLAARAALLSAVVDSMRDGVTVVDATGRVFLRNSSGERILGVDGATLNRVLGSPRRVFGLDGQGLDAAEHPWRRALLAGEPVQQELFVDPGDNTERRLLRVMALPLPPTEHDPQLAVVLFRDITEDRAQREALETFAEVVAHDLKAPLGRIVGWLELLEDGGQAGERARTGIGSAARAMEQLISSLLSFSLATHGSVALTRIDLGAVVRELCELRVVGTNGVPPAFTIGELPEVYGEPVLVRQLMDNLIGNACKYVPRGARPEVRISARSEDGWVEVEISDNGIGVPVEERERIFDAFHRGTATGYDGHGLGLAICKRIVERHGGEISVRAGGQGPGSRFVLTLPGHADRVERGADPVVTPGRAAGPAGPGR